MNILIQMQTNSVRQPIAPARLSRRAGTPPPLPGTAVLPPRQGRDFAIFLSSPSAFCLMPYALHTHSDMPYSPRNSLQTKSAPNKQNLQNKPISKLLITPFKKWIYNKNYPERNTPKQTHFQPIFTAIILPISPPCALIQRTRKTWINQTQNNTLLAPIASPRRLPYPQPTDKQPTPQTV
jgi:hypothetical protein